jgi:4-hydroxybenzoate polyprenyltransferase
MKRTVKRAWQLFRATHPEPVLAVTAGAGVLCYAAGRGASTAWAAAAVFSGQLFTGWVNDLVDLDRDRAAGRSDKPLVSGEASPRAARLAAVAALLLCVPLSLANGLLAGACHLAAVAAAFAYNLRLKSTPLSILPYAVAFGLLPAFVTYGLRPPLGPPLWATAAAALLGCGGHFTQVLPDIESDRRLGMRALPDVAGRLPSLFLAAALLGGGFVLVALRLERQAQLVLGGLEALLLAAVVAAGLAGRDRLAFRLTLVAAALAALAFLGQGRALRQP